MSVYTEVYKGRIINVSLQERKGGFAWSYTIDANHLTRCQDRALNSEELMLGEALQHAKVRIDAMSSSFEYKGRQVEIVAECDEHEQWAWSYTIDAGHLAESDIIPSRSKATAIAAAKIHAMHAIDSQG